MIARVKCFKKTYDESLRFLFLTIKLHNRKDYLLTYLSNVIFFHCKLKKVTQKLNDMSILDAIWKKDTSVIFHNLFS